MKKVLEISNMKDVLYFVEAVESTLLLNHVIVSAYHGSCKIASYGSLSVPTCPQEVPNGQIEAGCSREFDVKCSFGCTNGYTKTTQRGIRCGEDLTWEADIDTLCACNVTIFIFIKKNCIIP